MASVDVSVEWLGENMPTTLDYYRNKMTYACSVERAGKWPFRKNIYVPMKDRWVYWSIMKTFYPWIQMEGVWNVLKLSEGDIILRIPMEAYSMILLANKEK